jgi:hypothetical protein
LKAGAFQSLFASALRFRVSNQQIQRAGSRIPQVFHYVRIDHRGLHIGVAQVFLNLANVHPGQEQMGGERVARMDRFTLRGRIKVTIQWMLYCLVHNIEKILNFGRSYALATA